MSDRRLLTKQPGDEGEPAFTAPWQAQAFALTLALHEAGVFSWPEWTQALSAAIADAQADGDADLGDTYYHHWLTALEHLVAAKEIADDTLMTARREAWERAASATPHGKPIVRGRETWSGNPADDNSNGVA